MYSEKDIVASNKQKFLLVEKIEDKKFLSYLLSDDGVSTSSSRELTLLPEDFESGQTIEKSTLLLNHPIQIKTSDISKKIARLNKAGFIKVIRSFVHLNTVRFYDNSHKLDQEEKFIPGKSKVPYAGRVFDEKEVLNLVDSSLDFWLTSGPYTQKFEKSLSKKLGVHYSSLVNSGSSANLLAFMALTSPRLKPNQILKGDEVITVAAGFPTTVAPVLQYGAVPVFVDIKGDGTYNIDPSQLPVALSEKTRAVMLAHTLGNPFDLSYVKNFCDEHKLWLIEDNCDALGSRYQGQLTGTFGDIGTSSFYPPHHITMGEGGAVYTKNSTLKLIIESFRDWGRDCWCDAGKDNTCKKRFGWEFDALPKGYDHKYIYSHFGYNLKATDMQAAIGCIQLEKLEYFAEARRRHWKMLYEGMAHLEDFFILPKPTDDSDPAWFGFALTVRKDAPFQRTELVQYLESKLIQTRMLFAGNLTRQPCFDELRSAQQGYRTVGDLECTDQVMNDTFWVGVYPGMKPDMIAFIIESVNAFCCRFE